MTLLFTDSVTIQRAMQQAPTEEDHKDNTIPDKYWRDLHRRMGTPRFDSPEAVRQVRVDGMRYRAGKRGWN